VYKEVLIPVFTSANSISLAYSVINVRI